MVYLGWGGWGTTPLAVWRYMLRAHAAGCGVDSSFLKEHVAPNFNERFDRRVTAADAKVTGEQSTLRSQPAPSFGVAREDER